MAGSWGHIVDDEGRFIGTKLLENEGDVKEALEECYGMVWWLAQALAETSGMGAYTVQGLIDDAEDNYQQGLEYSPSTTYKRRS